VVLGLPAWWIFLVTSPKTYGHVCLIGATKNWTLTEVKSDLRTALEEVFVADGKGSGGPVSSS
jgi:hypothetical protein